MLRNLFLSLFLALFGLGNLQAQHLLSGQVQDENAAPVPFANVALYVAADSTLLKVEVTDDAGIFRMTEIPTGNYTLEVTFLGAPPLRRNALSVDRDRDLGVLKMEPAAVELQAATITATRALVEIRPDRTVFNVQGTINAIGENGIDLLRKAPGVTVDNNNNINVLSRSGVLVYIDGKRLPLTGDDLTNYLRGLTAEQIDRIDIITNPSAKYEAQGNAGIIDIRLKKAENTGGNGTASTTISQGRYTYYGTNLGGNYRNAKLNIFGSGNYNFNEYWNEFMFNSLQNGLRIRERNDFIVENATTGFRLGTDFFLSDHHTLGFLVNGQFSDNDDRSGNRMEVFGNPQATVFDSVLIADNTGRRDNNQQTYNINYQFNIDDQQRITIDLDYGRFRNDALQDQPNRFFAPNGEFLSEAINYFDTPTDIDISTAKMDYERPWLQGQLAVGVKFSQVATENSFLFFDVSDGIRLLNTDQSNLFDYDEKVYAAYVSFSGKLDERTSFNAGLRSETTDATGELSAFRAGLGAPPVDLEYTSLFPSAGVTYQLDPDRGHTLNLNYGRRINRPDYNVLNPFRTQLSQLSFETGNPFLNPEIVDNVELGYTHAYSYNFKLSYSQTSNQITRLIGPDAVDRRASSISWQNLATQTIWALNVSAPITFSEWLSTYVNINAARLDNQADYGDGVTIDLQAFTYNLFLQNTIKLPGGFTGEVSGYFSGPGVWGGVFRYNEQGALNLGIQKQFLGDQLNVRLSFNDVFFTSGFNGNSEFNGLVSEGSGNWDSRRAALSISYNFGNQKVKSRQRRTGLEEEAGRVGG